MQFIYHQNSGETNLLVDGELYNYIFKVKRLNKEEYIFFRNLNDKNLYQYKVTTIDRRKASLELISFEEKIIEPKKELHIGWCKIDSKSIEKYIASLNELGVSKITIINCEFSQKQFKINFEKLEKLLINSSQQSGRSSIIDIDISNSLEQFIKDYPNSYMLNFSKNNIETKKEDIDTIILGCEGGFSNNEIDYFNKNKIVGIDSDIILRSETAIVTIASKILV
ncbi:MAG: 16S rRNA (uracil(1498)-N(3))-methyltransferase [Campylobacterota bacterium]|nr:16S rRNA (uracil(1498)-N(3))-methyltransferase [Campylobacterota bacterium]